EHLVDEQPPRRLVRERGAQVPPVHALVRLVARLVLLRHEPGRDQAGAEADSGEERERAAVVAPGPRAVEPVAREKRERGADEGRPGRALAEEAAADA